MITIGSVIAIIAFLFGAYAMTNKTEVTEFPVLNTLRANDHMKWSKEKKNIIIEYSDLQCPACQAFHQLLREVAKDDKITKAYTFVYRHYPLDSIHPNARNGAQAAEAASKQGKFFEMHDILFDRQSEWTTEKQPLEKFKGYAKELKLNVDQFEKDFNSKEVKDIIQKDLLSGNDVEVNATPTFFINGKKITNPQSIEEFQKVLLENIK